jgi:hypothetical protein
MSKNNFHQTVFNWSFLAGAVLLIMVFVSCRKYDEQAPVIQSVLINETTGNDLTATAGVQNTFKLIISDNEALKQLKVNVSTLAGIHPHEASEEDPHAFVLINQGVWDTLIVKNLEGSESDAAMTLFVPDSVAGGWSLEVDVLDESGNLVSEEYSFQIFNPSLPQLFLSGVSPQPAGNGKFELSVNDSITLDLNVFASEVLSSVGYTITKGSNTTTQDFSPSGTTFEALDLVLGDFNEAGSYTVIFKATAVSGKYAEMYAQVLVE